MDNAQKFILIGVGLFITIIVIGAVIAISGVGTNLISKSQSKLGNTNTDMIKIITAKYDNKQWSGKQLLEQINIFYNEQTLGVVIWNKYYNWVSLPSANVNGISISFATDGDVTRFDKMIVSLPNNSSRSTTRTNLTDYKDPTNRNYIISTDRYKSVLVEDLSTGYIIGISFAKITN